MDESILLELPKRAYHQIWLETALLLVINLTAFLGNLSVCCVVYRNQRLRAIPNMFVLALALSDILISTCNMPFSIVTLLRGEWMFGSHFCRFHGVTFFMFSMVSLHTMGIIAVSRYYCVVKPHKYPMLFSKRNILAYISIVWFAALVGITPPLLFDGYRFKPGQAVCMYAFETNIAFTVFVECVYIATPLAIITICYVKVFYTVSRTNLVFQRENNREQLRANVEEVKVTKTLAAVMAGFAFCWIPISIMDYITAKLGEPTLPRQAYLTYGYLGYLSSTINPFIYGATNRRFRQGYRVVLGSLPNLCSKCFRPSNSAERE